MPPATLDAPDDFDASDDSDAFIEDLINDARRAEMEARFGARFFQKGAGRLPPDIERLWLDHIEEFERLKEAAESVPLRRFAGLDAVPPLADLPESAVPGELRGLLERLLAHGVHIEFPQGCGSAEAYRLLVEHLLDEPVLDLRLPGLRRHFVLRRPE